MKADFPEHIQEAVAREMTRESRPEAIVGPVGWCSRSAGAGFQMMCQENLYYPSFSHQG